MSSTATVTIPQAMEAIANDPSQFISRLAAPTVRPETIGTDVSGTQFKGTFFRTDWQGLSVAGRSLVKAPGSAIKQVNVGLQDQTISIPLREAQTTISVPLRDRMDAKGIQSYEGQIAAPALTNAVMLEHEQRLASLLSTGSNWGSNFSTGAAGTYWDDPSFDVVQSIAKGTAASLKVGKKANKLVLGWAAFFALKQNPYFKSLAGDIATGFTPAKAAEIISELISINLGPDVDRLEVLILSASQNSSELGQASTNAFINSNFAWVGHVAPQDDASLYTRSALYTFEAQPFALREGIIETVNEYSYTAYQAAQVTIVEPALGFCFQTPVQTPANYGG